jgi:hypothetical protein
MCGVIEANRRQAVSLCPGPNARIDLPISQEKSTKVLTRHFHRHRTGSHQVAHRFMDGVRDPILRSAAGAVQPRQHHSVASIRFDPIPIFDWDQRRRNHRAGVAEPGQKPMQAIAAGASFVADPQLPPSSMLKPLDHLAHNVGSIGKNAQCRTSPERPPSATATEMVVLCTSSPT